MPAARGPWQWAAAELLRMIQVAGDDLLLLVSPGTTRTASGTRRP